MALTKQVYRVCAFSMMMCFPLVSLCEETETSEKSPHQINLHIKNRHITGGATKITVTQGQWIALHWVTDEAVSLHLHGYDIEHKVSPGNPAVMQFKAHATGRFPITSHGFGDNKEGHGKGHHAALLYLEVYPK